MKKRDSLKCYKMKIPELIRLPREYRKLAPIEYRNRLVMFTDTNGVKR